MPVIVDASIKGKLKFPTMPNVVSRNDDISKMKTPAGMIKTTLQNAERIEISKGKPHQSLGTGDLKSAISSQHSAGSKATHGLSEISKGVYSTVG